MLVAPLWRSWLSSSYLNQMTAFFFIYPPLPLWFDLILATELNRELNQVNRMNVTANIVCYKSKTLSNGEHPLMIRVCKDGKKKYKGFRICHTLGYKFHYWTITFEICCGYIVARCVCCTAGCIGQAWPDFGLWTHSGQISFCHIDADVESYRQEQSSMLSVLYSDKQLSIRHPSHHSFCQEAAL